MYHGQGLTIGSMGYEAPSDGPAENREKKVWPWKGRAYPTLPIIRDLKKFYTWEARPAEKKKEKAMALERKGIPYTSHN